MKHIGILHPTMINKGGAEFFIDRLASELAESGFKVTLLTDEYDFSTFKCHRSCSLKTFDTGKFNSFEFLVPNPGWNAIVDFIAQELETMDSIILHNYPAPVLFYLAKGKVKEIPSTWFCQEPPRFLYGRFTDTHARRMFSGLYRNVTVPYYGSVPVSKVLLELKELASILLKGRKLRKGPFHRKCLQAITLDQEAIKSVSLVLANSSFSSGLVKKVYGREAVPCILGDIRPDKQAQNGILDSRISKKYFITISRLEEVKNIKNCIHAFSLLRGHSVFSEYQYLILGAGSQEAELKQFISTAGLDDCVRLMGFVSEDVKESIVRHAKFSVYVPADEPFGLACVEAMASSKAIITSDHGGPSEIVTSGEGIKVNPANVSEISQAMLLLMTDEKMVARLGASANQRYCQAFRFEHFMQRFLKLANFR